MGMIAALLGKLGLLEEIPEKLDHCEYDCREPECTLEAYGTCKEVWGEEGQQATELTATGFTATGLTEIEKAEQPELKP